jgi:hypothetical protein
MVWYKKPNLHQATESTTTNEAHVSAAASVSVFTAINTNISASATASETVATVACLWPCR